MAGDRKKKNCWTHNPKSADLSWFSAVSRWTCWEDGPSICRMDAGKHVIFLGAGASKGSGYPLANELRLLISSQRNWEKALCEYGGKHNIPGNQIVDLGQQMQQLGTAYWLKHRDALGLFRNGGFATLDEFCKLAGTQFQAQIQGLRCLVRAALGLFNPEETFEKSEYYGFVQALFAADLESLRDDVAVLTYNYDPYLEFLLFRALQQRRRITRARKGITMTPEDLADEQDFEFLLNAATSGFYNPASLTWADRDKTKRSFCVLKLHGSICYREDDVCGFNSLFEDAPLARAKRLFSKSPGCADQMPPPLLFPWEILDGNDFIPRSSFPYQPSAPLYDLFVGIWNRARREVESAKKISFVGLSMHDFLSDGLKFLFAGKTGQVDIVVANPGNANPFTGELDKDWANSPHYPAHAVHETLRKITPNMVSSRVGHVSPGFILVRDFAEFVRTQMKPFPRLP